jgi:hypothetical protein
MLFDELRDDCAHDVPASTNTAANTNTVWVRDAIMKTP